jgi:hypothetical protein
VARRTFDFYETPPHYVTALQKVIGVPRGSLIEPCVGKGALIDLVKVDGIWRTNDLNPRRMAHTHLDASKVRTWRRLTDSGTQPFTWGITNPPFRRMLPIVRLMLGYCRNVAVLARLSFLEPTFARGLFWKRWTPGVEVILLPRYSFTGNGKSDNQTCVWLVWRQRVTHRQLYASTDRGED